MKKKNKPSQNTIPIDLLTEDGAFLETWNCPKRLYRALEKESEKESITIQEIVDRAFSDYVQRHASLQKVA